MIVGYNPKNYIKDFLEDLKEFADTHSKPIQITCVDEEKDIYNIVDNFGVICSIELWDITNYDNNLYQELKIKYTNFTKLLDELIESEKIKVMSKGKDYITFLIVDDILSDIE